MFDALGLAPSRSDIMRKTQELKKLLNQIKECDPERNYCKCKCLYDTYLEKLAELTRDNGEFYEDQWWINEEDQNTVLDVYGLPTTIEGLGISERQWNTQKNATRQAGSSIDNNIFNKYDNEIENGATFAAGASNSILYGFGQDIAELIYGPDVEWADTNSVWYKAGELAGDRLSRRPKGKCPGSSLGLAGRGGRRNSKGERNWAGKSSGTNNPWKKDKPHPKNPNLIKRKDQYGNLKDHQKPEGWDDWWNSVKKNKH